MHVNSGTLKNRPEAQDTHSLEGSTSDSGPYQKKSTSQKTHTDLSPEN